MKVRLTTDLLTGLLFLVFGLFVIVYGSRYPLGSAARMGPGFYPLVASSGLALLGVILIGRAAIKGGGGEISGVSLRPLLLVLLGTLAFGLLIERFGFLAAGLALVVLTRFAERDVRLGETVALALGLTAFTTAIFWYALGMPLRLVIW
jgi:putative tricarboxylic transport membrane protein